MNAEFNWWLLIVGLVIGASLTWLVMAETTRRESDVADAERRPEARWISMILAHTGRDVPADRVEEVLRLHRDYLAAPPPDEPDEQEPAGLDRAAGQRPADAHRVAVSHAPPEAGGPPRHD
jgi:hypothetical protein